VNKAITPVLDIFRYRTAAPEPINNHSNHLPLSPEAQPFDAKKENLERLKENALNML